MLQYLHIENIAVIQSANIEFTDGFNVLTGETGAGKSIIIDSLFAILGERTSRELIRHGCDKAVVSAAFSDIGTPALEALVSLGYQVEENEELIIQRTLFADGRGQVKINSQPATVSTLKEISKYLINIHGQHDSQNLLNPDKHITYIDAFAENDGDKKAYLKAFNEFKNVTKELKTISEDEEERRRRSELLAFQIDEIEKADIKIGEEQTLKTDIALMHSAESVLEKLNTANSCLNAEDNEIGNAKDILNTAKSALEMVLPTFKKAEKTYEALSALIMDLEGIALDVTSLIDEININPNELQKSIERLDLIHNLMLKYGDTEENILEYLNKAKAELNSIVGDNRRREELEALIEPLQQALIDAGEVLTAGRNKAAKEISKRVENELRFLDFNGASFITDITEGKYTKNGKDVAEFLISANVGELPKPLAKVASGGELSRIMLAIRSVLSLKEDAKTLIFDEIDSGISGHAAGKVATKLKDVSKSRQVICVTHLAQLAAAGDNHLFISKSVKEGKTYTAVTPLDYEGRVRELARIISGGEYTENLLNTAREMLSQNI